MCLTCRIHTAAYCPCHGNHNKIVAEETLPPCAASPVEVPDTSPVHKVPVRHNSLSANGLGECAGLQIGPYESKTKILHVINGGSFGHIYVGECLTTSKLVAVKAEKQGTGAEKLLREGNVYNKLMGGPGIPEVYWYGMHGSEYNFLTMEILGPSLEHLFDQCSRRFSLASVITLLLDMLEIIKFVHGQNFIHRDISPGNFVVSKDLTSYKLYLIDYGFAKKCNTAGQLVLNPKSRYGFQYSRPMVGTPRFMSLGIHQGATEGRRDDLESIVYMCLLFLKGSLPWQGKDTDTEKNTFEEIARLKASVSIPDLCSGLPNEFERFLKYTRALKPSDFPDYDGLVKTFKGLAVQEGIDLANVQLDWRDLAFNNNNNTSIC